MDPKAYEQMAGLEDRHWWFVGRRQILSRVIAGIPLPPSACILEAGCGSGGNLEMLSQFGQVWAMERSEIALPLARARGIAIVEEGELPHRIPFGSQQFDLIALLDVLEHLDEDTAALEALIQRLKPSGYMVITVPAYPWLWSAHDELNHHKRRYTAAGAGRRETTCRDQAANRCETSGPAAVAQGCGPLPAQSAGQRW